MSIAEKLTQIAENEQKVYHAGYEKGKAESGDGEGSYNQGFDDGKQDERESFWNSFLNNRNDLSYAFYNWKSDAFYPTRDVGGTSMQRAFYFFGNNDNKLIDLKTRCEECGIKLDFTRAKDVTYCFGGCENLYALPTLELIKVNNIEGLLNNCKKLKHVEKIVFKEDGTQTFTSNVFNCPALEEVRFEGTIGQNGFNVGYCPLLSHDSLMSIINVLQNKNPKISGVWKFNDIFVGDAYISQNDLAYSVEGEDTVFNLLETYPFGANAVNTDTLYVVDLNGKTVDFGTPRTISKQIAEWIIQNATSQGGEIEGGDTFTVTLSATNLAKLTNAEKARATQKGWTLA